MVTFAITKYDWLVSKSPSAEMYTAYESFCGEVKK